MHFVGLKVRKWSRSKTQLFLDSDAVENNKHQTLSFPISLGFKRTPYDTKSYPRQTLFVYVGLTYKCIKHSLRKIFNLGGRGIKQLQAKQAAHALAWGIHVGPEGWPPGGGCKRTAPPCLRKFDILRARYAYFQCIFFWNYRNMWFSVVTRGLPRFQKRLCI